MKFEEKLRVIRENNGLTQEEVGRIIGVKREIISYYESGSRAISVTNLQKFLNFLGISMKDFKENKLKGSIQVAYRKDHISEEDFDQVIWLNKFVMNLSELKNL
ncbi:helix-turn-helix transcriptional regulator [Cetobacterium somerae]|uniref:helix-turn-helix domain-containing protein n=1 Tax=Cetobacterium TaxID=180162 RepID=UPI000645C9AC|nr:MULTISPECIES: helix-turn-helix transcriptional regulator [Cetobacterium]MCQ9628351.1 helix-turn-helix transcriptional regulator [Cetobacterium somerae]